MYSGVKIKKIFTLVVTIIIALFLVFSKAATQEIRQPAVSGLFYPDDSRKLLGMRGDFLKSIEPVPSEGEKEHSIEVQLPFLQAVVRDFSIVPVLLGNLSWDGD